MSIRYAPLLLTFLVLLGARTSAFNVYHLGGTDGHPWQTALSYEPGDYQVLNPDGTAGQRLPLAAPSTHPTWEDTLADRIDSVGGQWLRPFFLPGYPQPSPGWDPGTLQTMTSLSTATCLPAARATK